MKKRLMLATWFILLFRFLQPDVVFALGNAPKRSSSTVTRPQRRPSLGSSTSRVEKHSILQYVPNKNGSLKSVHTWIKWLYVLEEHPSTGCCNITDKKQAIYHSKGVIGWQRVPFLPEEINELPHSKDYEGLSTDPEFFLFFDNPELKSEELASLKNIDWDEALIDCTRKLIGNAVFCLVSAEKADLYDDNRLVAQYTTRLAFIEKTSAGAYYKLVLELGSLTLNKREDL